MRLLIITLAIFLLFKNAHTQVNRMLIEDRCQQHRFSEEQLDEMWKWTRKCFPEDAYLLDELVYMEDARSTYPTFVSKNSNQVKAEEYMNIVTTKKESDPCDDINQKAIFAGICMNGCYLPDQKILFSDISGILGDRELDRDAALEFGPQSVIAFDKNASIENPSYVKQTLKSFTVSPEDAKEKIYSFTTITGKNIKVTLNHPLVNSDGIILAANQLKKGDALLNMQGEKEEIVDIAQEDYFGKVWNVGLKTDDRFSKVVVAQGLLTGDVSFQNENIVYLNQLILRKKIPDSLLDEE